MNAPSSTFTQVLRDNPRFQRIWLAEVISGFGDWFNLIASATLIGKLTGSGVALGALFLVRMLAPFVVSPIGGVLADRYDRARLMVLADLCRAPVALAFWCVQSPSEAWLLYVLTALHLGLSGVFVPARAALLPDVVSPRDLGAANSLIAATYAVMQALGAAAGGVVAAQLGPTATFIVDALTFLVSALLCAGIAPGAPRQRGDGVARGASGRALLAGLRYLERDVEALLLTLHKGINCLLVTGGLNVVIVHLAQHRYAAEDGGAASSGVLFACTGVGSAIGALIGRYLVGDEARALRLGLMGSYAVTATGLGVAAADVTFLGLGAGILLRGVGGGMLFVFSTQLLFQRVPGGMRGRIMGLEYGLRTLMSGLGMAIVSVAVDSRLSESQVFVGLALGALLPGALWAAWLFTAGSRSADPAPPLESPLSR